MYKRTDTRLLQLVTVICLVVGAASWLGQDFFFGKELDAAPDFLLILIRFALVLTVLLLVSALFMKLAGLERTRKYITALILSTFLVAASLFGEVGWVTARYGISRLLSNISNISASYKPPILPITFMIDTQGRISIQGELSIVTPIGDFAVNTSIPDFRQPQENVLQLAIIHVKDGAIVQTGYKIYKGKAKVVVIANGVTRIEVSNEEVTIDASNGNIQSIQVQQSSP